MISLRLPPETESRLSALALREHVSRSEWIRRLIDRQLEAQTALDPHAQYLKLTSDLPAASNAAKSKNAAQHSQALRGNPKLDRRGAKTA
ncbi:MAG: ribbon-helix-helix protein, CopG family [Burkholderiales bacterium]|jgi:Ribbon-helix-helix protein, copG family|nr:MAG: ribbon-helix-helix protein, CopG family [Burkholderiales bacterium]